MKAWKKTARQRRRRWPWRHGSPHYPDWPDTSVVVTAHDRYRERRWYIRTRARRNGVLNDLHEYLARTKAECEANGHPLPLWHPDSPDAALAIARAEYLMGYEFGKARRAELVASLFDQGKVYYPSITLGLDGTMVITHYDPLSETLRIHRSTDEGSTWTTFPAVWPRWAEGLRFDPIPPERALVVKLE